MRWRWLIVAALLQAATQALARDRPAREEIGSWLLTCPPGGAERCELRHRSWILPPTGGLPTAALEVAQRSGHWVPVVALHGLSTQAALGVVALQPSVGLRFDAAPRTELACGLDAGTVVCAPSGAAAASAADALATARSVVVQVKLALPGGSALPEQLRAFELQRTQEALARFRAVSPADAAVPVVAGLDWRGMLDRLARDAADLLGSVSGTAARRGD
jgi:hypothetical protein